MTDYTKQIIEQEVNDALGFSDAKMESGKYIFEVIVEDNDIQTTLLSKDGEALKND